MFNDKLWLNDYSPCVELQLLTFMDVNSGYQSMSGADVITLPILFSWAHCAVDRSLEDRD